MGGGKKDFFMLSGAKGVSPPEKMTSFVSSPLFMVCFDSAIREDTDNVMF